MQRVSQAMIAVVLKRRLSIIPSRRDGFEPSVDTVVKTVKRQTNRTSGPKPVRVFPINEVSGCPQMRSTEPLGPQSYPIPTFRQ